MRAKHLMKLPLGDYYLTNGIYEYVFSKNIASYDGSEYASIRQKGSLTCGSISFNEVLIDVFDDSSRYKMKVYKSYAHISGLVIVGDSNDNFYFFDKLKFIPKSSYKAWLKKVESSMSKLEAI